ncbi:insulinase family protein [Luteimonas sp. S4-F44]|uniref:M16 family metallopeptidase n=1 Tax=Luteimonas sp. S4-F44 TaxID=2925842 RepID=UPI001F5390E9|nr:pitrilysin family protein [Luteimonas sp. S4-F44]UNK42525.1 insulinase family protein [Luteimonas sp. S4-F44]
MRRRLRVCLVALLLCAGIAPAIAAPQPDAPVHSAEGITEYRFDNGLQLVLFPDPGKPVTTVNVTYRVGSRHEGYGETGMAHLLEHLLFKGTPTHPDIPGEMKRRGIRFNGTTWFDRTNYFASFSSDPATLDWLLGMEADRMVASRIAREDLDSEMTVVRNELEAGENNPVRVLVQRLMSAAYDWHNYGNPTIGARSDIEGMPIARLQAFYRTWYRPDNAVVVIAGDFDPAHALERVAAHFGTLPQPASALPRTYTREPAQDGERHVVVRRVGCTPYLAAGYHIPAGRHPDAGALAVLAQVLGHAPSGRLHRALVEPGLATSVSATGYSLDEPGYLSVVIEAPAGSDLDALQTRLLDVLEQDPAPFTDDEVDEARARLLAGFERALRDPNAVGVALSDAIAQGDWRLLLHARDRLETVTAADVQRVARTYLRRDNRTTGHFVPTDTPERIEIPEAPDAATLLAGFVGRPALAAGEAFDPTPEAIDARTRTWTLSNGARLAVLDKATRGQAVQLRMTLRLGSEDTLTGRTDAAMLAGGLLMRGAGDLDRAAISRRLTALRSTLGASGGATTVSVAASTDRAHLVDLLDLTATVLRRPTFPQDEFEQLRTQWITGILGSMSEPGAVANQAMAQHFDIFPPGHPFHARTFEQRINGLEATTRDEAAAFHLAFYGMGPGTTIAIVGDVDAEAVRTQLEALFGDWRPATPFVRIPTPYAAQPAAHLRVVTPDRPNAVFLAQQALPLGQDHPDYPALLLGNHLFGSGGMKSRLADRIRQRDGLSYGVSSSFGASAFDTVGTFSAQAIAAPENIAKVAQAFDEELRRLLTDGIDETELTQTRDGLLLARRTARASDAQLAGTLNDNLYLERDMAYSAAFEDRLRGLDAEAVRAAMARHLDPDAITTVIAGDLDASAAGP